MFKEDIKIEILNEEHFNKVKEILVKEGYDFLESIHWEDKHLFAYGSGWQTSEVKVSTFTSHFEEHQNKEYVLHNNTLIPKEQANKPLTPCEQLGYKEGDKFIFIEGCSTFDKGTIVELFKDDGTKSPLFKGKTTKNWCIAAGEEGAYAGLNFVKPFKESNTTKEEKKMTEVTQQKATNKEPKNKPKTQAQLVFTYTNGKKHVVRGLQQVKVFLNGDKFQVDYTHSTYDGVKHQTSNVYVYVTNELVKVEKINTDNSVEVILDLSSATAKAVEGTKKPRGNARSKEQWEAMVEAKKAQEDRNKALVEAKARELAAKMLKERKI